MIKVTPNALIINLSNYLTYCYQGSQLGGDFAIRIKLIATNKGKEKPLLWQLLFDTDSKNDHKISHKE